MADAFQHAHFPHTMLLSGKAGYGLFSLGWAIAQYILCSDRSDDACGVCANCKKVRAIQHPDLHVFFPTAKADMDTKQMMGDFRAMATENQRFNFTDWLEYMGGADKSLNINKRTIDEINHAFSFKAFEGGARVYLIWGAEFLGKEGNKLLKVIEEPPEDAYIILMTENRRAILTTILSRCQTLLLKPLQVNDMLKALNLEDTPDNIKWVSTMNGDARAAQHANDHGQQDYVQQWISILRIAFKGNPTEVTDAAADLGGHGKEFSRQFIKAGMGLISQMLKLKMGIPLDTDIAVEKLAKVLTLDDIESIQSRLQDDYFHVNRNANLKLLFTSLIMFLTATFRK